MDTTRLEVRELASEPSIESAFKTARDEFDAEIRKRIERPAFNLDGSTGSTTVLPFFNSCRELVQEKLEKSANGYSALRWLWYLRRLPVYRGKNCSTPSHAPSQRCDSASDFARERESLDRIVASFLRRLTTGFQALNGVFEDCLRLFPHNARKPQQKIIERGSALEILE
jgi:hypothetical protein